MNPIDRDYSKRSEITTTQNQKPHLLNMIFEVADVLYKTLNDKIEERYEPTEEDQLGFMFGVTLTKEDDEKLKVRYDSSKYLIRTYKKRE